MSTVEAVRASFPGGTGAGAMRKEHCSVPRRAGRGGFGAAGRADERYAEKGADGAKSRVVFLVRPNGGWAGLRWRRVGSPRRASRRGTLSHRRQPAAAPTAATGGTPRWRLGGPVG
ncbi:hypothetical protein GCM10010515_25200 [Streptomyces fructofermentans]|uniref:Uncharacterized protein n=1 Tax=Streptomyces fructofermentans TaxID=152141 RepID=A0A918KAH5_9ACTN|nr:hypothetical protein GCM10010515_25200 [Streptomyces fructofermentans]